MQKQQKQHEETVQELEEELLKQSKSYKTMIGDLQEHIKIYQQQSLQAEQQVQVLDETITNLKIADVQLMEFQQAL